jgi:methylmalonyl-CoA/ethylmalonyl-CoA epimerase
MSDESVFQGVQELGLAVEDLDAAIAKFEAVFGTKACPVIEAPDPGIQMKFAYVNVGDQRINLMQDIDGGAGPIGRAVKRRGEHYFNSIIQVKDLDATIERLRAAGVELVEDEPRLFENGEYAGRPYITNRVVWTNPRTFHGMLVEFQEFVWASEEQ